MSKIINDVVKRTNGEMFIGVVGSVRSGKSMFIRKFMQTKVLPYVTSDDMKDKITDELPQSAEGKTIMTVEPKFIPTTPIEVVIENDISFNIRLVDCVGYIINNSKGYQNEDGSPRLVKTPWFSDNIAFEDAATIGTKKVISNHSHIGIVMTSDGSFGEFSRDDYRSVEEKIINELKELQKPFVIVVNTTEPNTDKTKKLVDDLTNLYGVSVVAINVMEMNDKDIDNVLTEALNEFNISKLEIKVPTWISSLADDEEHKVIFNNIVNEVTGTYRKFKDVRLIQDHLKTCELFNNVAISSIDSSTGEVEITIDFDEGLYDEIIYNIIGDAINDKGSFIDLLQNLMKAKKEYDKVASALEMVKNTGYGIAIPDACDMELATPEVIKQNSRYGIKLKANAPSIHMIKVNVESTFEPIIGTEEQSKNFIDKLIKEYESDQNAVWNAEIFGKKLSELVNDGVKAKLYLLPENVQRKLAVCLEKIVNKSKGSLLAIIL